MKKITIIILSLGLLLIITSCGGPKADVKKMIKMIEEYTEVANDATEDKVLHEEEIEELNEISKEMEDFSKEMDKKYEDDDAATKEMEDYMKEDKIKEIYKNYTNAMMALWDCEGAENLK